MQYSRVVSVECAWTASGRSRERPQYHHSLSESSIEEDRRSGIGSSKTLATDSEVSLLMRLLQLQHGVS